jgi:hypothetical protein
VFDMSFRVFLNNVLIDNILQASLSISNKTNFERALSISLYDVLQTFVQDGDEIEVFEGTGGTNKLFGGIINGYSSQFITPLLDDNPLFQTDISSDGYGIIPQRRIVSVSYTNTNVRQMVLDMLNSTNLGAETITAGTISPTSDLPTIDYSAQFKSIADVLDELADASGHVWYIDNSRRLHFIEMQGVTNAPYTINTFNGTFRDFHNLSWSGSTDNYSNKVFVFGDGVSVAVESSAEIAIRATEADGQGTGIYGYVIEDSNIKSQFQANQVANAHLRKYANSPGTLSFSTYKNGFEPGQRLQVQVEQITGFNPIPPSNPNIWYYLIEEVTIELEAGGIIKYNVSATRRNNSNFSTQKSAGFKDYFKQIVKKG